jgi:hypothetical protein
LRITDRILVALLLAGGTSRTSLAAQQRDLSFLYGSWSAGDLIIYEARLDRPLGAVLRHGVALQVLTERSTAARGFYGLGYELESARGGTTVGLYGVASAALGMVADTGGQALAALWTAGLGAEWRPFRIFGLDLEERYRVVDRGPHGFWNPGEPRKGFGTTLGVSIGFGGVSHRSDPPSSTMSASPAPPSRPRSDPPQPPLMLVGRGADVVQTALDVLGSPYQWGGTADNGFDCSGLIQYAYARHGIRLPRTSRDQAVSGAAVPPMIDSLQPGDILAFVGRSGGSVTHVGLYIGEGKFIHSSSTGVKLSRLDEDDPDGAYWIPKWVGARRVLQ